MGLKLRGFKDKLSKRRKGSTADPSRAESGAAETIANATPSFLGLPAELRNDIYHILASSTTLVLTAASPKKRPLPPGLLIANRQTWKEYRAILLTHARLVISVTNYNFSNIVRTFEKLTPEDLAFMKLNPQLSIRLWLSHVPSRDDRRALRAWCDYRGDENLKSYFGSGQRIPNDIVFNYDVMFLHHMRPPRPMIRYANGYEMRADLLGSHLRMTARLRTPEEQALPDPEMARLRMDFERHVKILQELAEGRVEDVGFEGDAGAEERQMSVVSMG